MLLLREWDGFQAGEDFSGPLASDWLRLSEDPYDAMVGIAQTSDPPLCWDPLVLDRLYCIIINIMSTSQCCNI